MPSLGRRSLRALVVMIALALSSSASADPIAITSGRVEAQILVPQARVLFEGTGFLLDVAVEGLNASLGLICTPCAPGTTIDLGGSFAGPAGAGRAFVDGVTYPQIFVDGMTGTFESPSFELTATSGNVTIRRPFTYSGVVNGYLLDPFIHGITDPVFTATLTGGGIATATLLFSDTEQPLFLARTIRYDFASAGPVPEPTTLILSLSGAAALVARRHGRRWMAHD